ncbi:hypothetical protein HYDPIDRAFT_170338 [Hydnomerulius pinastri MD-312]|uniref:Uncharacterized protein n=1 Tax=Hydnomerulius pinastri MD-312 TaxID=994086 RepID=A0A0C9V4E0_9AGAM|nr:hypothetical protein HYDPIDRAFT_170338 [Hydnomerulius pinastri MD-312]
MTLPGDLNTVPLEQHMERRVLPVQSGYRVTLTYNLYFASGAGQQPLCASHASGIYPGPELTFITEIEKETRNIIIDKSPNETSPRHLKIQQNPTTRSIRPFSQPRIIHKHILPAVVTDPTHPPTPYYPDSPVGSVQMRAWEELGVIPVVFHSGRERLLLMHGVQTAGALVLQLNGTTL